MTKKYILFLVVLCSFTFILLTYLLSIDELSGFDCTIYNFFAHYINYQNTAIMILITSFGNWKILVGITIIFILIWGTRKYYLQLLTILFALTSSYIFDCILKEFFQRPRPDELRLVIENDYSFPSAHALVSFCFYGFIIYHVYKNVNSKWKYLIIAILVLLVLMIGLSRIYLGVHYPSDVMAGYCVGFLWLLLIINIMNKWQKEKIN